MAAAEESVSQLLDKCEEARSLSKYETLDSLSAKLIESSQIRNNRRAEAYAYFYNGLAKLFMGKADESQTMLDRADVISGEIGNDSVRALVYNSMGIFHALVNDNRFVAQQFFFKSLELANGCGHEDLQYRVRGNLLTLSQSSGGSFALENAQMVYEYGVAHQNIEQISLGAYYLATYYYNSNNYDEAEKYLNIALEAYEKYPYEDISSVYDLYAKMLLCKNDVAGAEQRGNEAMVLAKKYHQSSMEVDACITLAEIMNYKGEYKESNAMLEQAMSKAEEIGVSNKAIAINGLLAKNYSSLGEKAKALDCLQKANSLLLSQSVLNMERLSHEQEIMHDIEQKEMEAKLRQEQIASQQQFLIMLCLVVLALVVLLVVIIINYRHRNMLYKSIVLQNTKSISRQAELQSQVEQLTQLLAKHQDVDDNGLHAEEPSSEEKTTEPEQTGLDIEKINLLYTRLCHLMDNERLYAEPQLTREKMAERLGTNRTYLTTVIKEKTGMNYLQFVNSYRINEAVRILSDKDKIQYPLKQIWSDLGFSSPSTFFKLFQQAVGITPSVYRKQFMEVTKEEEEAE